MTLAPVRPGRPPVTSREDLERVAMRLFADAGFDATTVDDIATAAGIGRRTFFRYFASKNDVVWGRFDEGLHELRGQLAATPPETGVAAALREAVVRFNDLPPEQVELHRQRMTLILSVSSLQAHSTLMYAAWRDVIAEFVAGRIGADASTLLPRLVGHLTLGAAVAAYEQWLDGAGSDLRVLLDRSVTVALGHLDDDLYRPKSRRTSTGARP